MQKIRTKTITILFIVGLVTSAVPLVFTSSAALSKILPATNLPPQVVAYCNAGVVASINISSIGNITTMGVSALHPSQMTFGSNFDTLALTLTSPLAKGPAQAIITSGPDDYVSFQEAVVNGSSVYTIVNGAVIINNEFRVSSNELKIQRNGTRMTVDFNPVSPVAITLPPALFPAGNFSATWILPAFHIDVIGGNASAVYTPYNTATWPSGWIQASDLNGISANVTFTCPSWNSYSVTTVGGLTDFQMIRFVNPLSVPFPLGIPAQTMDYYTGGAATVTFPQVGNITQMTVAAYHVAASDHVGSTDVLSVTLTGPQAKGTINPRISSNPNIFPVSATTSWLGALVNGTTIYTEVDGKVIINNLFVLGPNQVSVQRNGTRVSVDFKPTNPVVITLDAKTFPPGNFSSTWTLPAFHMDLTGDSSNLTIANPSAMTLPNGWTTSSYYDYWSGNATISIPSWNNFTTTGTGVTVRPFVVSISQAPFTPKPALDVTARQSVTVLPGWTWWFYVQSLGGNAPYTYQWYEGSTLLQGQNQMVLPASKTAPGVYRFYCVVVDSQGTATTSNAVTLTVLG